jgi:hypothetical protein
MNVNLSDFQAPKDLSTSVIATSIAASSTTCQPSAFFVPTSDRHISQNQAGLQCTKSALIAQSSPKYEVAITIPNAVPTLG